MPSGWKPGALRVQSPPAWAKLYASSDKNGSS